MARTITESQERILHTGGDQFVPPRFIEPTEGAFLRNIRTGEIWPYSDTLARMGDQMYEPTNDAPEWWERRVRINEAKAAQALTQQMAEQEAEEAAYMQLVQKQAARETLAVAKTTKSRAKPATTATLENAFATTE